MLTELQQNYITAKQVLNSLDLKVSELMKPHKHLIEGKGFRTPKSKEGFDKHFTLRQEIKSKLNYHQASLNLYSSEDALINCMMKVMEKHYPTRVSEVLPAYKAAMRGVPDVRTKVLELALNMKVY